MIFLYGFHTVITNPVPIFVYYNSARVSANFACAVIPADGYLMHVDSKRGFRRQTSMTGEVSSGTTTSAGAAAGLPQAVAAGPASGGVPQLGRVYSSKFAA
jgi:hypothetical protein